MSECIYYYNLYRLNTCLVLSSVFFAAVVSERPAELSVFSNSRGSNVIGVCVNRSTVIAEKYLPLCGLFCVMLTLFVSNNCLLRFIRFSALIIFLGRASSM